MILDGLIVLAFVIAALSGRRRGFVRPLFTQLGIIAVIGVVYLRPDLLGALLPPGLAGTAVVFGLVSVAGIFMSRIAGAVAKVVYKVPLLRAIDPLLGIVLAVLLQFVTLYIVVAALSSFDGLTAPIHRATALGPTQVADLRNSLARNSASQLVVDPAGLERLQADSRKAPVALEALDQYERGLALYELKVRPQLVTSFFVGAILNLGVAIPVLGHEQAAPPNVPRDQPPQ